MNLTLAIYGFFLLPLKTKTCAAIVAPRVPTTANWMLKHDSQLCLLGDVTSSTMPGIPPGKRADAISVAGSVLSFGQASPADVDTKNLLPDFEVLKCGSKLDSKWSSQTGDIETLVHLSGGSLTAYADAYTNAQVFTLDDCGNKTFDKRISSLAVYQLANWGGELTIASAWQGGPTATIKFSTDTKLGLLHEIPDFVPVVYKDVDDAHAEATLRLCSYAGSGPLQYGVLKAVSGTENYADLDDFVKDFLKQPLKNGGATNQKAGRPNCGLRVMQEP